MRIIMSTSEWLSKTLFITVTNMALERNIPNDESGFTEAISLAQLRHQELMPPYNLMAMEGFVIHGEPIENAERDGKNALKGGNFEQALYYGNWLFAYGQVDLTYNLGSQAFQKALNYHQVLAFEINRQFGATDSFLKEHGPSMFEDVSRLLELGDEQEAFKILRAIVHVVAANGTLGEDARKRADVLALVSYGEYIPFTPARC